MNMQSIIQPKGSYYEATQLVTSRGQTYGAPGALYIEYIVTFNCTL